MNFTEPDPDLTASVWEEVDAAIPPTTLPDEPTEEEQDAFDANETARQLEFDSRYLAQRQDQIAADRLTLTLDERNRLAAYDTEPDPNKRPHPRHVLGQREKLLRQWVAADIAGESALVETRLQAVKDYAGAWITAHVPEWKQRNMIAWSADLTDRVLGGHTPTAEGLEKAQIQGIWAWVQSVRSFSDSVEARIEGGEVIEDLSAEPWPPLG